VFEIGNSLREARLRQQLEFPELELATKIRSKYLRALEEEQFDVLPAQTYVKGFLRTYADQLGLDGQLYVDEYNSRYVVGEDEPPSVVRPRQSAVRPGFDSHFSRRAVVIALAAIGLLFALVIGAWKFGGSSTPPLASPSTPRTTPGVTRATPPVRPARTRPAVLVLRAAKGSSWLRVNRGSSGGPQVYQGTLQLGQSLRFVGRRLVLRLGAPTNVSARLNGRLVALPGSLPTSVLVTRSGIRQAPAGA
jgi:cytoskeleton protein RodZ